MMRLFIAVSLMVFSVVGLSTIAYFGYPEYTNKAISEIQNFESSDYVDFSFVDETQEKIINGYNNLEHTVSVTFNESTNKISGGFETVLDVASNGYNTASSTIAQASTNVGGLIYAVAGVPSEMWADAKQMTANVMAYVGQKYDDVGVYASTFIDDSFSDIAELKPSFEWQQFANNTIYKNDANDVNLLVGIEPSAGGDGFDPIVSPLKGFGYQYDIEDDELNAEAVLVPRSKTVISSSRDGKIKKIHFENGDEFKKGDTILEYYCEDLRAEMNAANAERKFAKQKELTTSRLFNLELSSDLEVAQSKVEKTQAQGKAKLVESRIDDCIIRAEYAGRVVKRMANDNEYTRTDRVLMEIASKGTLDVEFLLPSKSLRWINMDAPISLNINETDREYKGKIKQIYGEVDPVSQSIQIRAGLDDYVEPLLPGMSGQVTVNVTDIREAGIAGFLETKTQ